MMVKQPSRWKDPSLNRRAVHIKTSEFLHMGGVGETTNSEYAWIGIQSQFFALDLNHDEYRLERLNA